MVLAWWLAALLAIGQAPSRQGLSSVGGVVVDARTAQPIADARVVLVEQARSTQTGGSGRFEFKDVTAGSHTLTISLIGYSFARRQVDVRAGATLEITIPLAEGAGTYQETVTVAAGASARP